MKTKQITKEQAIRATVNYGGVVNLPVDSNEKGGDRSVFDGSYTAGKLSGSRDQTCEIYMSEGQYYARVWEFTGSH
jgi:hypothetical protein